MGISWARKAGHVGGLWVILPTFPASFSRDLSEGASCTQRVEGELEGKSLVSSAV